MSAQKYECHQCQARFEGPEPNCLEDEAAIKCPQCGSKNVGRPNASGSDIDLFRQIMALGGG